MGLRHRRYRIFEFAFLGALLFVLFQNCSGTGFQLQEAGQALSQAELGSQTPDITPTPVPGTSPTPQITPTPTPVSMPLLKTRFYYGRNRGVDILELNHATGVMTQLASTNFSGTNVGWLTYHQASNTVFAADADGGVLQLFNYNATNGAIASKSIFPNYSSQIVHLTVQPRATGGFSLFGSSYNRGSLDHVLMNDGMTQLTPSQSIAFGANAKTHSSSYDSVRKLLYVANLGNNKIDVYSFNEQTGLTALTSIMVTSPRTVVYDSTFDKVFVATEASVGNSYIRIFSVSPSGASFIYADAGSLAMPLIGGDLKVNHAYRYVMATAREDGKEAIYGLPVTTTGVADTTRQSFSIPVAQDLPRALQITEDGLYAVVGMNSSNAENVVAYKMTFNAQLGFVSSQKIFEKKIDNTGGYLCGLSIPMR